MDNTIRMPDWLRFPLVLTVVATVSAVCLAVLWYLTLPHKERIQAELTEKALKVVMPEATSFEPKEGIAGGRRISYRVAKRGDEVIGYVAEGQAAGYSSVLKAMVGVDTDFVIQGIEVLSQKETPGLGDKVDEVRSKKTWWTVITGTSPDETGHRPWFQEQFKGKTAPVKADKDGGEIEAITGATISSRAVCKAVDEAVEDIEKAVGSQPTSE